MFATRAGWLDKYEVTEVWFDKRRLSFTDLLALGVRTDCAQHVWATTTAQLAAARDKVGDNAHRLTREPRADKDPKYYLLQTPFKHVPMTRAQAARCNAVLAPNTAGHPKRWLSPRQLALFQKIQREKDGDWPVAVDVPIAEAWAKLPDK